MLTQQTKKTNSDNMKVNFEEKTYENYFNTELDGKTDIYFPLGQVQEGNLGFDSSAFSQNEHFWKYFGYPHLTYPGVELREIADEMENFLKITIDDIPIMKSNILFQYKKPKYIKKTSGKEWLHWNQPYYRYDIYKKQQELLMQIHNSLGSKVLIIYASPAIKDVNELVKIKLKRELIENSNFRKASELNSHHRNTYVKSGTHSIACSEPERFENLDLISLLNSYNENYERESSNADFITNFSSQIDSIINENEYFSESFSLLKKSIEEYKQHKLLYSFLMMNIFKQITGNQWLIKI